MREKCYDSQAEKQRAYRLRKKGKVLGLKEAIVDDATNETREGLHNLSGREEDSESIRLCVEDDRPTTAQNNLPVDVQPEPTASDEGEKTNPANVSGEARESTEIQESALLPVMTDCRGRQKLPKGIDPKEWAYACERAERARKYSEMFNAAWSPLKYEDPMWQWENQVSRFGGRGTEPK